LLKKSKGLNSRLIELNKFDIREFQGELSDKAKIRKLNFYVKLS